MRCLFCFGIVKWEQFIVLETKEIDTDVILTFYFGDLLDLNWVIDSFHVELMFMLFVVINTLWMSGPLDRMKRCKHRPQKHFWSSF